MTYLALSPVQFPGVAGAVFAPTGTVSVPVGTTGLSFPSNGLMALYLWTGNATTLTVTSVIGKETEGIAPAESPVGPLTTATGYWFGNWSASDFLSLDGTGNMYLTFGGTIGTTTACTLYQMAPKP